MDKFEKFKAKWENAPMEITLKKQINSKEDFELLLKDYSLQELSDGISQSSKFEAFLQPWADEIFVYKVGKGNYKFVENILLSDVALKPESILFYLNTIVGQLNPSALKESTTWLKPMLGIKEYLDRVCLVVEEVNQYFQSEEFKDFVLACGTRMQIETYTGKVISSFNYTASKLEIIKKLADLYNIFDDNEGEIPANRIFETEVLNLISAFADKTPHAHCGYGDFFLFPNRETFQMVKEKCREIARNAFAQLKTEFEILVSMGEFLVEFEDGYNRKFVETVIPPTRYEFVTPEKVLLKYPFSEDVYEHYLNTDEFGFEDGKENSLWKYVYAFLGAAYNHNIGIKPSTLKRRC